MKKLWAIGVLSFSLLLTAPSNGFSQPRGPGGHPGGYYGGGYGGYRDGVHRGYPGGGYYGGHRNYSGSYHRHHYNDDIFWGVTGFLFGTALGAAIAQPPVYSYSPPAYYYAPQPPMCRYERYVTDQWGRTYREYYAAPCR